MANEVSKIKLPNDTTEYPLQDDQAIASITRSGTTFTATRRDGTSFTFTQQDNNTTYTFATGDNNGQIKVTPSGGTAQNVSVKGLGTAAYKGTTTSVTSESSDLVTSGAVYTAIDNLPEPMIFKGSLGTGGTITTLPTASSANEGFTYKVITVGTYASQSAKVGDLFISNGTDWIWIPSGDEPSGTVTSITLKATSPIAIDSSSAITTSGTRTLSHANSGVTAGTYKSVTVNATGHVTGGTNPTTLSGYGITDAKIASGTITLGSNSITPLTSHQTVTDNNPTLAWGTKSKVATIGSTEINVTMPANPNTTYTLSADTTNNKIKLTPSSGSAQSITVPYATTAESATTASKLGTDNVGSATKPIYLSSGTATACTYSLNSTVNSGTSGRIAYYSGANAISSSGGLKYYTANSTASTPATRTILRVFGQTYGNTAANMISGTAGLFTYGDGSPQIAFSASENETSNSQDGTLIFTDHDTAATGVSWHFVSNQSDWNVTSKRFHARTGISIGTDLPQNWNGLQVQGINQNWLNVGKSPVIYMKKSDGGASGALGMDTKTGRAVIATYPNNDDSLYFNWYSDETLTGTVNQYDAQMKWTPSTNTLSTNISGNASTISNFRVSTTSNIGLTVGYNAIGYVSGLTSDLWNYNRTDGCLYTQRYNDKYQHEIFGDYRTGRMSVRGNNNGTWQDWKRVIVDEVLSNQDLNDIKIPGFYRAGGSNTVTNVPSTAGLAFGLLVIQSALGQYCYQLYNQAGTNNTWRRSCSNGTWSAWVAENINNTNTTYTIGTNGNNITLTPSSGSVQSITAPYATSAGSATKATQDGSGNTITSTYVKKSGDTMTGTLTLYREGTTANNVGTELKFSNKDTTTGKGYADAFIRLYDGGENGGTFVIKPGGNLFIGSGEAASSHYALYTHNTSENFYATSDSNMFLQSNGGTIANRVGMGLFTDHTIRPIKADVSTNNVGSIGTSSYRWNEIYGRSIYSTRENQLITGSGTAAQDKGEGVSPRYFPAKWTFNAGLTIAEGDTFTIKLPVIGHDYGTYLSLDNGTTYYPVIYNGTSRFGGQFPANSHITVIYDPNGSATSVYPLAGGNDRVTVTGGAFRVLNLYDANNNVTVANTNPTTGTWYYPVWYTATSGTGQVRANDGFRHYSLQGTASAAGRSIIQVGNATQTGTAGNKYGEFRIYSQKQGYSTLTMASGATAERKHTLPDVAGTIGVFTATPTSGQVVVSDGTAGGFKTTGYTIAKSVPSNAVFTDTNNAVTQTQTTTNANYDILFSASTTDAGTKTEGARKDVKLTFNPSHGLLSIHNDGAVTDTAFVIYSRSGGGSSPISDVNMFSITANGAVDAFTGITTEGYLTVLGSAQIVGDASLTSINNVVVGSSPKFTDANLTQTKTTTNATYDILFSSSTTNTDTKTEGGRKSPKLSYNPSTGQLKNQGTYSACNSSGVETSYLNTRVLCLNTNKSTSDDYYMEFRYGSNAGSYYTRVRANNVSGNRNIYLPTTDGTLAIASSDIRLKENIMATEVPNATSIINQIQLHSFDWKSEREPNDRHWKIGVIADELEELDPRFTLPGSGGYNMDGSINAKTVDTFYLMGYLIKTIQELSAEINQLKEKIK